MAVERIEYSRELIEGFRRKGVVLPSSLRLLKDAERELSGKNYDKALVISKNAQSDAKKRYREFLRSQDLLKKIDAIKRTAPPEVVESIERALKESKGYLTSGQYVKFNRVAENLIQELRSDLDRKVKKRPEVRKKKGLTMEEAVSYLQAVAFETLEAQKAGLPTSEVEEILRKARDFIDGGFYREATNLGGEALDRIEELKREHEEYAHQVEAAEQAIEGLREQGMRTATLEKLLSRARTSLKNVDYPQLTHDLERLYERMDEAKQHFKQALETIDNAEVIVSEAAGAGANISFAASLLEEAKKLAEKGDYAQAKKIAEEAHEETVKSVQITLDKIHREEQEYNQLQALISEAEETISECSQYVPIPAATDMLDRAKSLLKEAADFEEVHRLAVDAKALAMETKKQYIETTENVQEANRILSRMKKKEFDVKADQAELVTALDAIDEHNYLEALRISKKVLKRLKALDEAMSRTSETIERAAAMVEDVVGILEEDEIRNMESDLEKARIALSKGDFDRANEEAGKIVGRLEDLVATHREEFLRTKDKIGEMRTAVELLRREGVKVDQLLEILEAAEDELRNREFAKAMQTLDIADDLFIALRDAYDRAKTMLTAVQMILDGMKKRGVDVTKFEATYNEAQELFKNGDYEGAFARAEGLQKECMPDLATYQTIEESTRYVSDLRRQMHMIREGLPAVVDVEEKLGISGIFKEYYRRLLHSVVDKSLKEIDRADTLISEGKIQEAKGLADEAMRNAENVGERYQRALEYLYQAKTIVNEIEGPDISAIEDLYKQAKSAMEMADYNRTIRLSEEVIKRAEPLIEKYQPSVRPLEEAEPFVRPLEPEAVGATVHPLTPPVVRENLDRTWEILREFEKVGLDVDEEKAMMQNAEQSMQNGDLLQASQLAETAKIQVVQRGEDLLIRETSADPEATTARDLLDRCQEAVRRMNDNNIKHRSVELLLQRGEEAYAEGRHAAAIMFAEEALNKANRVIYDWKRAEHLLKVAEQAAREARKDVSTLIDSAVTEFESRNFRYAMRLTERILDMLDVPPERYEMEETPPEPISMSGSPVEDGPAAAPVAAAATPLEGTPTTVDEMGFETDWSSFEEEAVALAPAEAEPWVEGTPAADEGGVWMAPAEPEADWVAGSAEEAGETAVPAAGVPSTGPASTTPARPTGPLLKRPGVTKVTGSGATDEGPGAATAAPLPAPEVTPAAPAEEAGAGEEVPAAAGTPGEDAVAGPGPLRPRDRVVRRRGTPGEGAGPATADAGGPAVTEGPTFDLGGSIPAKEAAATGEGEDGAPPWPPSGEVTKEEWLEEHKSIQSELMKLKERYLQK